MFIFVIYMSSEFNIVTFQTFLNQRHGYRALMPSIPKEEFNQMMEMLRAMGEDLTVFNTWYKEDANSLPPVFVLQQISSIIPGYKSKVHLFARYS